MLNHIITESIGEDFSWERRNRHARTFALEYIAEIFKIAVAAADGAVAKLECGDIGAADNFVVGVHVAADAVSLRVGYL